MEDVKGHHSSTPEANDHGARDESIGIWWLVNNALRSASLKQPPFPHPPSSTTFPFKVHNLLVFGNRKR